MIDGPHQLGQIRLREVPHQLRGQLRRLGLVAAGADATEQVVIAHVQDHELEARLLVGDLGEDTRAAQRYASNDPSFCFLAVIC
jgi:hypothetical protein